MKEYKVKRRSAQAQVARKEISQLINDGASAKDIAEIVDCSLPFVYVVAREMGYQFVRGSKLDDRIDEIRESAESGFTPAEMARQFGVDKNTMINFCKGKGIEYNEAHERFVESIPTIVKEKHPNFEYVDGYTNRLGFVRCRCLICGNVTTVKWIGIKKGYAKCSFCEEEENKRIDEIKRKDLLAKQERKRIEKERQAEEQEKRKAREKEEKRKAKLHPCPVCGEITDRKKYCSNACANKVENKKKEMKRRNVIKDSLVDNDITLQSLYKRDGGVCYLCGLHCIYDDYVTRGDTFIAGDWYPSIDHVIPLAKGGQHSWDNVRLAHRRCNSLKSDTELPPHS